MDNEGLQTNSKGGRRQGVARGRVDRPCWQTEVKVLWAGRSGRSAAKRLAEKLSAQLLTGTYEDNSQRLWQAFVDEYEERVLKLMKPSSQSPRRTTLKHLKRLINPVRVKAVDTRMIDTYVALRKKDRPGISVATVNHELRELRAVVKKAVRLGYLERCPEFTFGKEPRKLATYLTPAHFALLYRAADKMTEPAGLPFSAADYWRGLLTTAFLTGWRIGSLLALRWEHVDLEGATALSLAEHNKGGRDQLISLPQIVIDHVLKVRSFVPVVFPHATRKILYREWHELQDVAGVAREDKKRYGFHDIRRAFATMNHTRVTPEVLQKLMQHKNSVTTQRYIRMATELKPVQHDVFIPDCLALA